MYPLLAQCLLSLLLGASATLAFAHDRSESFSQWTWRGENVRYSFSILQREVMRIPEYQSHAPSVGEQLAQYLGAEITVTSAGKPCLLDDKPTALKSREGYLRIEGAYRCAGGGAPTITINSFFDLVTTHTHYVKVRAAGQVDEFVFTGHRRSETFKLDDSKSETSLGGWHTFVNYIETGARHIVGGADHVAFLFGIMLLASNWREMIWLITGFTIGHSLSLIVAVLGLAQPNSLMVEALIGYTIALVAIEAAGERSGQLRQISRWLFVSCVLLGPLVWLFHSSWELVLGTLGAGLFGMCYLRLAAQAPRRSALRLLVTSTFGLIHGFGFAGGLLALDFPVAERAFVLLGFNLGVELGQLALLGVAVLVVLALRRRVSVLWRRRGLSVAFTALTGLGTFWFVSRLMG